MTIDFDLTQVPDDETIAAVKERLRARGLLSAQRRSALAGELPAEAEPGPLDAVVDPLPLPLPRPEEPSAMEPPRVVAFADDVFETALPTPVQEDTWDVPGSGALAYVRCPGCRTAVEWPSDVTRFRCDSCDRAWRFAICKSCDELSLAVESTESWRCRCGAFTRSWWRTDSASRDAHAIVGRRRHLAVLEQRRIVREGMRARRWKLILFAIVSLLATLCVVGYVRMNEPKQSVDARTACAAVDQLRGELASGNMSHANFKASLDEIEAKSADLGGDVGSAIVDLAAAGEPGTTEFLVAQTKVGDACERVRGR